MLIHPAKSASLCIALFYSAAAHTVEGNYRFRHFDLTQGLPQKSVPAIEQDRDGYIWIDTERSDLDRFDIRSKTFGNYGYSASRKDGLQGNEFNPQKILLDMYKPKVVITQFSLFNQQANNILLDTSLQQPSVHLQHYQNMLTFGFSGLHYAAPKKQQYRYRLDGFNDNWISTTHKNRIVTYTNLAPGNYTFRVKSSNQHGHWSDEKIIDIVISPPIWLTWWAKIIYGVLAALIPSSYFCLRTRAVRKRNRLLEIMILNRTKDLVKEKHLIERLLNNKAKEFENISHEFRTPLAIIKGRVEQQLKKQHSKDLNSTLIVINKVTRRLAAIVDDAIALGKVELEKYDIEDTECLGEFERLEKEKLISISSIVDEVCDIMKAYAKLKNQTFTVQIQPNIFQHGNPKLLEKLFSNLVSNAIKYTDINGAINVTLSNSIRAKDTLEESKNISNKCYEFIVCDNGMGIANEQLPFIFARFYRCATGQSSATPGSGIGLSLVKDIIDIYQGEITVTSELGKGCQFKVTLPGGLPTKSLDLLSGHVVDVDHISVMMTDEKTYYRRNIDQKSGITVERMPLNNQSKSLLMPVILVVEDNVDMCDLIEDQLSNTNQIITAANGEEGLKSALRELPDIIISDITMPIMGGYSLLNKIKNHPATSHIPVVLLTAKGDAPSRIEGFKYRADGYITKPYDEEELIAIIKTQLSNREKIQTHALALLSNGDSLKKSNIDQRSRTAIERSIEYIQNNYQNSELSITSLASAVYLSERQLLRKFQDTLGVSPSDYINDYRLKRARPLVIKGLKVAAASQKTGFSSAAYFSKQYKKKFGLSPKIDAGLSA